MNPESSPLFYLLIFDLNSLLDAVTSYCLHMNNAFHGNLFRAGLNGYFSSPCLTFTCLHRHHLQQFSRV